GFDDATRAAISTGVVRAYRKAIREFATMRNLDVWYARVDVEEAIKEFATKATSEQRKRMEKNLEKTRTKDSLKAFSKLTEIVDGTPRIVSDPPLIVPIDE